MRSRSPLRHAESLEELNSRRLALESELALIAQKTSEMTEDISSGPGYTDESGARVSGLVSAEKANRLMEWFSNEIPADEARRLRTCFIPQLEGQRHPSIICPPGLVLHERSEREEAQ